MRNAYWSWKTPLSVSIECMFKGYRITEADTHIELYCDRAEGNNHIEERCGGSAESDEIALGTHHCAERLTTEGVRDSFRLYPRLRGQSVQSQQDFTRASQTIERR